MKNKFKHILNICPATISAMEDVNISNVNTTSNSINTTSNNSNNYENKTSICTITISDDNNGKYNNDDFFYINNRKYHNLKFVKYSKVINNNRGEYISKATISEDVFNEFTDIVKYKIYDTIRKEIETILEQSKNVEKCLLAKMLIKNIDDILLNYQNHATNIFKGDIFNTSKLLFIVKIAFYIFNNNENIINLEEFISENIGNDHFLYNFNDQLDKLLKYNEDDINEILNLTFNEYSFHIGDTCGNENKIIFDKIKGLFTFFVNNNISKVSKKYIFDELENNIINESMKVDAKIFDDDLSICAGEEDISIHYDYKDLYEKYLNNKKLSFDDAFILNLEIFFLRKKYDNLNGCNSSFISCNAPLNQIRKKFFYSAKYPTDNLYQKIEIIPEYYFISQIKNMFNNIKIYTSKYKDVFLENKGENSYLIGKKFLVKFNKEDENNINEINNINIIEDENNLENIESVDIYDTGKEKEKEQFCIKIDKHNRIIISNEKYGSFEIYTGKQDQKIDKHFKSKKEEAINSYFSNIKATANNNANLLRSFQTQSNINNDHFVSDYILKTNKIIKDTIDVYSNNESWNYSYLKYKPVNSKQHFYFVNSLTSPYSIYKTSGKKNVTLLEPDSETYKEKFQDFIYKNATKDMLEPRMGTNILKTPYYYIKFLSEFIISIINEERNTYISSSGNEIKISLVDNNDALIFNLFLNEDRKSKYEFSYLKDAVSLDKTSTDAGKFFPFFDINDNGYIFRLSNGIFYRYSLEDDTNNRIRAFFQYSDMLINCMLKGDIKNYIMSNVLNKYIFHKNIEKNEPFTLKFPDNILYYNNIKDGKISGSFYSNKNLLYKFHFNHVVYYDNYLKIFFIFNVYGKILILNENKNIINDIKINDNINDFEKICNSYIFLFYTYNKLSKYFPILNEIYNIKKKKTTKDDGVYFDELYRDKFEIDEMFFKYYRNKEIEKEDKIFELNKEYTSDDFLKYFKNKSLKKPENGKDFKIIFVDDIYIDKNKSLKYNLETKNPILNVDILEKLNNNDNNDISIYCLVEKIIEISNYINMDFRTKLKHNLKGIEHKEYDKVRRIFFKVDQEKKTVYIYRYLSHTKAGLTKKFFN